jgi:hypothetical protein
MTTYAFPTLITGRVPNSLAWGYRQKTVAHVSPFTDDAQIILFAAYRHTCQIGYRALDWRDDGEVWAFLAKMSGRANRVNMPYWPRRIAEGAVSGSPIVAGAGQTGSSLNVSSMPVSKTVFLTGDAFSVDGRLKIVSAPVNSDGSGLATITFSPPIITAPANGASIVWNAPTCLMMLSEDTQRRPLEAMRRPTADYDVTFEEAFV